MAKQIKVRFGQGEMVLTKSTKFIGVQKSETPTARGLMEVSPLDEAVKKVIHPCLGGFQVVTVNKGKSDKLDDKKTLMRSFGEVEIVTNVYPVGGAMATPAQGVPWV